MRFSKRFGWRDLRLLLKRAIMKKPSNLKEKTKTSLRFLRLENESGSMTSIPFPFICQVYLVKSSAKCDLYMIVIWGLWDLWKDYQRETLFDLHLIAEGAILDETRKHIMVRKWFRRVRALKTSEGREEILLSLSKCRILIKKPRSGERVSNEKKREDREGRLEKSPELRELMILWSRYKRQVKENRVEMKQEESCKFCKSFKRFRRERWNRIALQSQAE